MSAGDAAGESTGDESGGSLDGVSNVLVLAPTMNEAARDSYYTDLLPPNAQTYDVLAIDYRRTPDQWLEDWQRRVGDRPQKCTIVSVGEAMRSASTEATATTRHGPNTVTTVKRPTDLTGLGIAVSEYLGEQGGYQTIVTFDSLTVLLQYVDLQRAFRFLHVLANRVATVGATAYYHMDPGAHDREDIATVASLFDAVAEFDDGEWSVQRRAES